MAQGGCGQLPALEVAGAAEQLQPKVARRSWFEPTDSEQAQGDVVEEDIGSELVKGDFVDGDVGKVTENGWMEKRLRWADEQDDGFGDKVFLLKAMIGALLQEGGTSMFGRIGAEITAATEDDLRWEHIAWVQELASIFVRPAGLDS